MRVHNTTCNGQRLLAQRIDSGQSRIAYGIDPDDLIKPSQGEDEAHPPAFGGRHLRTSGDARTPPKTSALTRKV
jgi:hypothetical protein